MQGIIHLQSHRRRQRSPPSRGRSHEECLHTAVPHGFSQPCPGGGGWLWTGRKHFKMWVLTASSVMKEGMTHCDYYDTI